MTSNSFLQAKAAATNAAIIKIEAYTTHSDRFRGFREGPKALTAEQMAAVDGENSAYRILKKRGKAEAFVKEMIDELLPDLLADQLSSEVRPIAIFTPGALGANRVAFNQMVKAREADSKGRFFIKDFDVFYEKLYAKLKSEGIAGYDIAQREVNFAGLRDLSGIIEAALDVAKNLNCSFIAGDNFDAHPKLDPKTAAECTRNLRDLARTHDIITFSHGLSPQESVAMAKGTRFEDDIAKVEASSRGFAAYFGELKEIVPVVIIKGPDDEIIYKKHEKEIAVDPQDFTNALSEGVEAMADLAKHLDSEDVFVDLDSFTRWQKTNNVNFVDEWRPKTKWDVLHRDEQESGDMIREHMMQNGWVPRTRNDGQEPPSHIVSRS